MSLRNKLYARANPSLMTLVTTVPLRIGSKCYARSSKFALNSFGKPCLSDRASSLHLHKTALSPAAVAAGRLVTSNCCCPAGLLSGGAEMAEDKQADEREDGEIPSKVEDGEPDFTKKHELEHRWTLWFDNPTTKQSLNKYGQTLRAVYTFETVEDFWCLYNNIRTPGQLAPNATFYLFKDGIEPKWEDPKNSNGGCWVAQAPKGGDGKAKLDAYWLNAVLACIGEQFTDGDEICGVAVNVRARADRVELWTKTGSNEAAQTAIGKQLRTFLDIPESIRVSYGVFSEKISAGTKAKDRYTV